MDIFKELKKLIDRATNKEKKDLLRSMESKDKRLARDLEEVQKTLNEIREIKKG